MRSQMVKLYDHEPEFEWRGQDVSRVENLSDIVFALALGMLVSASTPPATYDALLTYMLSIVPVTVGFLYMVLLWNTHFIFFRRYGVADRKIIWLNGALLLFILFVAYPLRFAFDSLFAFFLTLAGSYDRMEGLGISSYRQAGHIIALFYASYGFAHLIYQSMYAHVFTKADLLDLNQNERHITLQCIFRYRVEVLVAIVIIPLAILTPLGPFAGMIGILNWPAAYWAERRYPVES